MLYQLSYASSPGGHADRRTTRNPAPEPRNPRETHSRFPAYHGTGSKVSTRAEAEQTRKISEKNDGKPLPAGIGSILRRPLGNPLLGWILGRSTEVVLVLRVWPKLDR